MSLSEITPHPNIFEIFVSLSTNNDALFKSCYKLTHEMIITASGRRIFPTLEYTIMGLDPSKYYGMSMHFEFVDDKKYRFVAGKWTESPSTEEKGVPRFVFHQNSLQLGQDWMDKPVSFDQIRVTNRKSNEKKGPSFVHLFTQHKYIPVLTIYEGNQIVHVSKIDYTEFITVTAYHGNALNQLKTDNNPYATGSRQDHREKRQLASGGAGSSSTPSKKVKIRLSVSAEPSTSNAPQIPSPSPIGASPLPFFPMFPNYLLQSDAFLQQFQLFSQMFAQQQTMFPDPFLNALFPTPPPEALAQSVTPPVKVEPTEPTEEDATIDA